MGEERWTLTCLCGSDHCRGEVCDFQDLPFRIRRSYLRLGIVQNYLARQFIRSLPDGTECHEPRRIYA